MIIKNLTSSILEINFQELIGDRREYKIYLEPESSTDLYRVVLMNKEALYDKVELDGVKFTKDTVKTEIVDNDSDPDDSDVSENSDSEPDHEEDKFICDECGAEFASSRSLSSHKTRMHPKE